jgi:hypothetical protein
MTIRYDFSGKLSRAEKTPAGGARVVARVARTGVQNYRMRDGSTRREYRAPTEVFKADSLASFKGAAVTVGHPANVSPQSWKRDAVGVVLDEPKRVKVGAHEYLEVSLDVNDAETISKIDAGELVELSCGYDADFESRPGTDPASGESFDGYQRNIRINHVALLPQGQARAGREARLLVDSAEEIELGSRHYDHGRGVIFSDYDRGMLEAERRSFTDHIDRVVAEMNRK